MSFNVGYYVFQHVRKCEEIDFLTSTDVEEIFCNFGMLGLSALYFPTITLWFCPIPIIIDI